MITPKYHRPIAKTQPSLTYQPNWLNQTVSLALSICLIVAPSNLFLKFDQVDWAIRGLRIDYLLPKLYLSDLAVLLTLGLLLVWQNRQPIKVATKSKWPKLAVISVISLVALWLLRQVFAPYPIAALTGTIRLLSYAWLWWHVRLRWPVLKHSWFWWALVISLVSQSALAVFQFSSQHSLGSYQWLLGEPDLAHTYTIVRGNFGQWGELILPYGTTAHPNILAGWVVGGWLLLVAWWRASWVGRRWWTTMTLVALGLLASEIIWLTQSWSAAGLALTCLIWLGWSTLAPQFIRNWSHTFLGVATLTLGIFSSPWWTQLLNHLPWLSLMTQRSLSWDRRVWLATAAVTMWQQQPWLGVGINQFTAHLETITRQTELVRFVQPVHQVGWLWLAETGLLGIAVAAGLGWLVQQRDKAFWSRCAIWLWISLPLLIWDHYLLTIPTGLWLSWWWLLPKTTAIEKQRNAQKIGKSNKPRE